jgi:phosphoenolpyruvate-protein kinase (PTS system EI component)
MCWILLGLGLRDLSMAPRQVPIVKSIIRATQLSETEALVAAVMKLKTEAEVEELVSRTMLAKFSRELVDAEEATA